MGDTRVQNGQTSSSDLMRQNLESWYGVPVPQATTATSSTGASATKTAQVAPRTDDFFEDRAMGAAMMGVVPGGEAYVARSVEVDRARNDAIDHAMSDAPGPSGGGAIRGHFAMELMAGGGEIAEFFHATHAVGEAAGPVAIVGLGIMAGPMIFQELAHAHEAGEADGQRMLYQGGYARGAADALFGGGKGAPDTSTPAGRGYERGAAYVRSLPPERREALRDGLEARNAHDQGYIWDRDTAALTLELAAERHMNSRD